MEAARSERVQDLVAATLELAPGERTAFLARACGADGTLLAEVQSLIGGEQAAREFLETPPFALLGDAFAAGVQGELKPGDTLGGCTVLRLLGEGGMGEVYLAEDTRLERRVAVKLLKRHLDNDALLRNFRHERKVLAGLTHPNIARLYGGETTPEGRSYLVMEYVEGERLDHYCNVRALGISQRLALFRKVCAAVTYAHQNLVVHRDLKPANIRVTAEGEPKLLDFGIAKLLDPDAARHGDLTVTLVNALTPEYASPEQVLGESITTASDVYSLGVILYELLTGQKPYRVRSRQPAEVALAVCEQEPERPSTVAARGTSTDTTRPPELSPEKLRRRLKGDLDNIVTMAMRKEPARRYVSVSQFSDDIARHLDNLPVMARRDTLGYRAGKFVRRNKTGLAAAALVVLALAAGLVAALWQARRADRRFEDVRRLAHSLLFEMEPQIARLAGSTEVRSTLVRRALEYLDGLSQEAGGNRELRRELATAYEKVGDVQGNPQHPNLGDLKGGLASIRKARELRRALVASDPHDALARHELAHNYELLGDILWWSNQTADALANYQDALRLRRPLLAEQPRSAEFRRGFGSVQVCIGDVLNWNGRSVEALASYREALPVFQALGKEHPDDAAAQIGIARCLVRIGTAQKDAGDFAGSEDTFRQAENVVAPVLRRDPNNHSAAMEEWSILYRECEAFNDQKATAKALAIGPQMVGMMEAIVEKDPKNTQTLNDLADSYNYHGRSLLAAGRCQEAIDEYQKGLAIYNRLAEASPENGEYAHSCGNSRADMGDAHRQLGQLEAAVADEVAAQTLMETAAARDPSNNAPRRDFVDIFMERGEICEAQQRPEEARQWYRRALTALEDVIARKFTSKADPEAFATLRDKLADKTARAVSAPR